MSAITIEPDARTRVSGMLSSVLRFAAERPYAAMGLGLATGYVLAGGFFTPLTARVLRAGEVLAGIPEVQERLLGALEDAMLSAVQPE